VKTEKLISMNLDPIEVDDRFENHRYFQLVTVLDRLDCLKEIMELRTIFNSYLASPERLQQTTTEEFEQLRDDITFLATKYSRPASFESVMLAATLSNKVTLKDYKPVKFKIYDSQKWFKYPLGTTMTIILDQFTTKKELNELFDKKFETYKKKMFELVPDELWSPIYKELKDPKNITNIKRDRHWYWRNVKGESYAQIALSELSEKEKQQQMKLNNPLTSVSGVEGVKRSIQRYKKLLAVDM
jgi:hypothetical protein